MKIITIYQNTELKTAHPINLPGGIHFVSLWWGLVVPIKIAAGIIRMMSW